MKIFLALIVFVALSANAQNEPAKGKKYQLALPDQWKSNRSLVNHLIRIAPDVFPRLEGRQMCVNCTAPYTLMFFYDSLVIGTRVPVTLASSGEYRGGTNIPISNYECVTTFHFRGTWVLMENDSAIAELQLAAPSESFTARKKFSLQKDILVSNLDGKPPRKTPNPGDNPFHYINRNTEYFEPTITDILRVIEEKVRDIRP